LVLLTSWAAAAQDSTVDAGVQTAIERQFTPLITSVEKDIASLHGIAQNTGSKNTLNIFGTVTSDLARSFADTSADTDRKLQRLKARMLDAFASAANAVEDERRNRLLNDPDAKLVNESLPAGIVGAIDVIITAAGKNNASILGIHFAMRAFETITNRLVDKATTTRNPLRMRELYLQQAAYVYEISNAVLAVLNEADLTGMASLTIMKEDNESRIYRRLAAINQQRIRLRDEVRSGKLDDQNARRLERSYVQIIRANQAVIDLWNNLLKKTIAQQDFIGRVPSYISQVQQKQQLAKFQLETLRDVLIVRESLEPLDRIEVAMQPENLPLLELEQSTALRLVGGMGGLNVAR